jgi:hypothetical protein
MRRHVLALLPLLLPLGLAACTPPGEARRAWLTQFVGRPESELIAALGVPDRNYEAEGMKFLAFTEGHIDIVPPWPAFGPPWYGLSPGFPARVVQWSCETTVAVRDGVVLSFSFRGNAC